MSRRGLWMGMLATAACAVHPKPLPVLGTAPDISALAGDWAGEYRSAETRRTGHITFTLAAGRDTAFGDVIMVPPVEEFPVHEPGFPTIKMRAQPQVLTIRFVRVEGDSISGQIAPYQDPECECRIATTFRGRLRGNRIDGDFVTRHTSRDDSMQKGVWWAKRVRDKSHATTD